MIDFGTVKELSLKSGDKIEFVGVKEDIEGWYGEEIIKSIIGSHFTVDDEGVIRQNKSENIYGNINQEVWGHTPIFRIVSRSKTEEDMQTGTLKELNVQVGDVVEFVQGRVNKCSYTLPCKGEKVLVDYDVLTFGMSPEFDDSIWRIISRANRSPVREVTRKEIVPGVYGAVEVEKDYGVVMRVVYERNDLMEAIGTLQQIADAMGE